MSESVQVPFDNAPEQATLLLAAAEDLGLDPSVVGTYEGGFVVPEEVRDKAFKSDEKDDEPKDQDKPSKARRKKHESEEG